MSSALSIDSYKLDRSGKRIEGSHVHYDTVAEAVQAKEQAGRGADDVIFVVRCADALIDKLQTVIADHSMQCYPTTRGAGRFKQVVPERYVLGWKAEDTGETRFE